MTLQEFEEKARIARQRGATDQQILERKNNLISSGILQQQAPQSLGSKLFGGAINLGANIVRPVTDSARLVGATAGAMSTLPVIAGGKLYENITGRKTNVDESALSLANKATGLLTQDQQKVFARGSNSAGSAFEGGKYGAGVASLVMPGPQKFLRAGAPLKTAIFASGAVPGMLRGAYETKDKSQLLPNVVAGGITGAATTYALNKVFPAKIASQQAKLTSQQKIDMLKKAGYEMPYSGWEKEVASMPDDVFKNMIKEGTETTPGVTKLSFGERMRGVKPVVRKTPDMALDEARLDKVALQFKGTPQQKLQQTGIRYRDLKSQLIDVTKGLPDVEAAPVISKIKEEVQYDALDKTYQRLIDKELSLLKASSKGGKLPVSQIVNTKIKLGNSVFKSGIGSTKEVQKAIWESLDTVITDISPATKEITRAMSDLYPIAKGLDKLRVGTLGNVPIVGGLIPKNLAYGVGDVVGRTLQGTGGVVGGVRSATAPILGSDLAQNITRNIATTAMTRTPSIQPQTQQQIPQTQQQTTDFPTGPISIFEAKKYGKEADNLWVVHPSGKYIWNPSTKKWMEYGGSEKATESNTMPGKLDTLLVMHSQLPSTGIVGGSITALAKPGGNIEAAAYETASSSLAVEIAAAMGLKPLSEAEVAEVRKKWLPSPYDTQAQAKAKINTLKVLLSIGGNK